MDVIPGGGAPVTKVTRESWGARLRGSIAGLWAGALLLLVATLLLFLNEGRAVRRARTLSEGARTVETLERAAPSPALEGKLVHVSGTATTQDVLRDPELGVAENALRLARFVEMYQWREDEQVEERTRAGGGTEKVTTYTYERVWSSDPIDSSDFQEREPHRNPPFPIGPASWEAERVTLGELVLGPELVERLRRAQPITVGEAVRQRAADLLGRPVQLAESGLYVGANPLQPQVGDVRIRFEAVRPALVSVVGRQQAGAIVAHQTRNGTLALASYGESTADDMFAAARGANRTLTWLLRFAGFLAFFLGFVLLLRPLRVLADVVPMIGRIVGAGIAVVALGLAAACSLLVIAAGWFAYRPVLATFLLVAALGVVVWLVIRARRARPPAVPPPPVPA